MHQQFLGTCAALLLIGSTPSAMAQGNPLGAANPLAGAPAVDPYVGSFSDGRLILVTERSGSSYAGRIEFSGNQYSLAAQPAGDGLAGYFSVGNREFPLSLRAEGGAVLLETGGTQYRLQPSGHAGTVAAAATGGDPVLARGDYAVLTQDNAAAFVEGLRFVLGRLGADQLLQGVSDQQLYAQLARRFSAGLAQDQLALAGARARWKPPAPAGMPCLSPPSLGLPATWSTWPGAIRGWPGLAWATARSNAEVAAVAGEAGSAASTSTPVTRARIAGPPRAVRTTMPARAPTLIRTTITTPEATIIRIRNKLCLTAVRGLQGFLSICRCGLVRYPETWPQ